ncbi:MAG: hypothetical protein AB7O56_01970 [Bauldia sp.]
MPKPPARIAALAPLLGTWNTTGVVFAADGSEGARILATDFYEFFPGGHFMLHHVDARLGDAVTRSIEILRWDKERKVVAARSLNDRGGVEDSIIQLRGRRLRITGERMRFEGSFSPDFRTISGRWQQQGEEEEWKPAMDVVLTRA